MAAFNYLLLEMDCPACGQATMLRAQTHMASDYEGDERGRFMDREYRLGEPMWWFPKDTPDYPDWMTWGTGQVADIVYEVCPACCPLCDSEVYAVVKFKSTTPLLVVANGLECDRNAAATRWEGR
jgi:hypothetical protein